MRHDAVVPWMQGGKAAAKVLFGEISPSGKLPVTFYESLEELPDFTDYSMKNRTYRYMEMEALYPFWIWTDLWGCEGDCSCMDRETGKRPAAETSLYS